MQHDESFDLTRNTCCAPRVPLTEAQHADYCDLISQAASLRALGKREEAAGIRRVAARIALSGAPGLE